MIRLDRLLANIGYVCQLSPLTKVLSPGLAIMM